MSSRWNRYALPCVALIALTGTLDGQETDARVGGFVVDEGTEAPVEGALVLLNDGRETFTDEAGRFLFSRVRPGGHSIAAVVRGCGSAAGDFEVGAGQDKILKLIVTPARQASEEDRSRSHGGKVLTAQQLHESAAPNLLEAIRNHVPGLVGGGLSGDNGRIQLRGRGTLVAGGEPFVMLDGVRVEGSIYHFLRGIDPRTVSRVEILPGASAGWMYGPGGAADGVILVTSVTPGSTPELETLPPEACKISWNGR